MVFCPGARSTNILATETDKMVQLAQNGHVSKNSGQATLGKRSWVRSVFERLARGAGGTN